MQFEKLTFCEYDGCYVRTYGWNKFSDDWSKMATKNVPAKNVEVTKRIGKGIERLWCSLADNKSENGLTHYILVGKRLNQVWKCQFILFFDNVVANTLFINRYTLIAFGCVSQHISAVW